MIEMLKHILKSIAWGILTKDVYYRGKFYRAHEGVSPPFVLVKAWKRDSYHAFMDDPCWWNRIMFKEIIITVSLLAILIGLFVFTLRY